MKLFYTTIACCFISIAMFAQYDIKLVTTPSAEIPANGTCGIVRMARKGGKIKVKYFAARDDKKSVAQRFEEWKRNKNIIAVSSGTYMTHEDPLKALPVGICVDGGERKNGTKKEYEGLVIVYANGDAVVYNINDNSIPIKTAGARQEENVNLNQAMGLQKFMSWAQNEKATVFQTHLFMHDNRMLINRKSSPTKAPRRLLVSCKAADNTEYYYLINITSSVSLLEATEKTQEYLTRLERMTIISYIINLDPGRQDVFSVFDPDGNELGTGEFKGTKPVQQAANLLAFYYQ